MRHSFPLYADRTEGWVKSGDRVIALQGGEGTEKRKERGPKKR